MACSLWHISDWRNATVGGQPLAGKGRVGFGFEVGAIGYPFHSASPEGLWFSWRKIVILISVAARSGISARTARVDASNSAGYHDAKAVEHGDTIARWHEDEQKDGTAARKEKRWRRAISSLNPQRGGSGFHLGSLGFRVAPSTSFGCIGIINSYGSVVSGFSEHSMQRTTSSSPHFRGCRG